MLSMASHRSTNSPLRLFLEIIIVFNNNSPTFAGLKLNLFIGFYTFLSARIKFGYFAKVLNNQRLMIL